MATKRKADVPEVNLQNKSNQVIMLSGSSGAVVFTAIVSTKLVHDGLKVIVLCLSISKHFVHVFVGLSLYWNQFLSLIKSGHAQGFMFSPRTPEIPCLELYNPFIDHIQGFLKHLFLFQNHPT